MSQSHRSKFERQPSRQQGNQKDRPSSAKPGPPSSRGRPSSGRGAGTRRRLGSRDADSATGSTDAKTSETADEGDAKETKDAKDSKQAKASDEKSSPEFAAEVLSGPTAIVAVNAKSLLRDLRRVCGRAVWIKDQDNAKYALMSVAFGHDVVSYAGKADTEEVCLEERTSVFFRAPDSVKPKLKTDKEKAKEDELKLDGTRTYGGRRIREDRDRDGSGRFGRGRGERKTRGTGSERGRGRGGSLSSRGTDRDGGDRGEREDRGDRGRGRTERGDRSDRSERSAGRGGRDRGDRDRGERDRETTSKRGGRGGGGRALDRRPSSGSREADREWT